MTVSVSSTNIRVAGCHLNFGRSNIHIKQFCNVGCSDTVSGQIRKKIMVEESKYRIEEHKKAFIGSLPHSG